MSVDSNRVILGTVQLGMAYGIANRHGKPDLQLAREIIDSAYANGVYHLDTATAYGTSQLTLGQLHEDRFSIQSKWLDHPGELDSTLRDLRLTGIDAWFAHRSQLLLEHPRFWEIMQSQKESGRVSSLGVSIYHPSEMDALLDLEIIPDLVQMPMNILSHPSEKFILRLKEKGIQIQARSIFLQGLFLSNPSSLSSFFDPIKPWLTQFSQSIPSDSSKVSFLVQWVLENTGADFVVLGAENPLQIKDWFQAHDSKSENLMVSTLELPERILNPSMWPKQ